MQIVRKLLAGAALSGVCLVANSARAAFITITDNLNDPTINVRAGDFENGVNVNGTTASGLIREPGVGLAGLANVNIDETTSFVNLTGTWISENPSQGGTAPFAQIVNFFETPNGPISDILEFAVTGTNANGTSTITLYFASDTDSGSPLPPLPALPDVGVQPIVTNILETPSGFGTGFVGLSISAVSDVETVPVPSSAWTGLALLGGLGLVRLARRGQQTIA
jgi:hypothetical protein